MHALWQRSGAWLLLWTVLAGLGAGWLAHTRLQALHTDFDTQSRIAHRLLSQLASQHEATLATLVLLQPVAPEAASAQLARLYPQVQGVARRGPAQPWPAGWPDSLAATEARARSSGHAELDTSRLDQGQLVLVQAGAPASYALRLDLGRTLPMPEWPWPPGPGPVEALLQADGQVHRLQGGTPPPTALGWQWSHRKILSSPSQPLELRLVLGMDWRALPWLAMAAWLAAAAALVLGLRGLLRQWVARRRAEQLLRLGQVARLNTLGELAAGMAHELNQPLTAVLANSQAARRLLAEDPPDTDLARQAMGQAAEQAKRASAVVGRLRRLVEQPDLSPRSQAVSLPAAVAEALHLLEPELQRRQVVLQQHLASELPAAQADPVAVQQILHNLLMNALQALEAVPAGQRRLRIDLGLQDGQLRLALQDSGPGIAPELRARLFTPFATGRPQGLGLGLTLSQSLAESMGGSLALAPVPAGAPELGGACFHLRLPTTTAAPATAPAP